MRRGSGRRRPGLRICFGGETFGVITHDDQQLAGDVGAYAGEVAQHRCVEGEDGVEFGIDQCQFLVQVPVTDSESFEYGRGTRSVGQRGLPTVVFSPMQP
jgi:hypothetical protein